MEQQKRPLSEYFDDLTDPRVDRTKLHSLKNIVFLTIAGVLCGGDSWVEIEENNSVKEEWLSNYLDLPHGIPSHDTFGSVFSRIDPEEFEQCFLGWIKDISNLEAGEIIAIDGKTLRGSYDRSSSKAAIHMVSAWASANRMVIGQQKTDTKSNEITAIPRLLELLTLNGAIVTIDAMGCQKEIAARIVDAGADYVLALKTNQPSLHEQVEHLFTIQPPDLVDEQVDSGHGRVETRVCSVINDFKWFEEASEWPKLLSITKIERTRYQKLEKTTTTQTSYYISSIQHDASKINRAVRTHWQIENSLHWCLDVVFNEDQSRVRSRNAAQNFSLIRKIALNMLRKENSPKYKKASLRLKRKRCSWSPEYLQLVLGLI